MKSSYQYGQLSNHVYSQVSMNLNKSEFVNCKLIINVFHKLSQLCNVTNEIDFCRFFHTLSGRTGSSLVWHSEGRTIEALSVQ